MVRALVRAVVLAAVISPVAAFSGGPYYFTPITPCRLVDTRNAIGNWGGPQIQPTSETDPYTGDRVFSGAASPAPCPAIPADAKALSVIVTALNYGLQPGRFTIYPADVGGRPSTAAVNYRAGDGIANAGLVLPLSADGRFRVFSNRMADLVLDVHGFYTSSPPAGSTTRPYPPFYYYPITPCRLVDTRRPVGAWGGPQIPARPESESYMGDRVFVGAGASPCPGIPPGAKALSAIVTALNYGAQSGRFTIYPADAGARPSTATVNYRPGDGVANGSFVLPLSPEGTFSVYSNQVSDLVLDINGYYE